MSQQRGDISFGKSDAGGEIRQEIQYTNYDFFLQVP
jgi:hypothetical protein